MMPIRDWSQRRIVSLWLGWVLLLLALITWGGAGRRATRSAATALPTGHEIARLGAARQISDSQAVLLFFAAAQWGHQGAADSIRRDALIALLSDTSVAHRDSIWNALQLPSRLSPAQRDSLPLLLIGRPLESLARGLETARPGFWLQLVAVVMLQFGVPVVLGIITLRWYIPRVVERAGASRAV